MTKKATLPEMSRDELEKRAAELHGIIAEIDSDIATQQSHRATHSKVLRQITGRLITLDIAEKKAKV